VALNYITATTEASITNPGGRKNVTAVDDVTISAMDSSTIDADTGAGALSVSTDSDAAAAVAAGAAMAENRITRTTTAKLVNVRISNDGAAGKISGDVDVSAAASGDIRALTLGISGAVSTGATVTAALAGLPVHVITVNDYLAERDAQAMGPLYTFFGLRCSAIVHDVSRAQRRDIYAGHVTYVSNKELAFDYLRDRAALGDHASPLHLAVQGLRNPRPACDADHVLRGLVFAIVDGRPRAGARSLGNKFRETPGVIMPPLVCLALLLWLGLSTPSALRDSWSAAALFLASTP